jgi:hypothetical protein
MQYTILSITISPKKYLLYDSVCFTRQSTLYYRFSQGILEWSGTIGMKAFHLGAAFFLYFPLIRLSIK